jgi:hypothetical protein
VKAEKGKKKREKDELKFNFNKNIRSIKVDHNSHYLTLEKQKRRSKAHDCSINDWF